MNGFYPMLNDVHDKAARELPLAECALFEHLWRKLIGWNQWSDDIAISQLDEELGGSRATILRLLKKLETKRWIIVARINGTTNNIGIPKCPGIKTRLGVDPYQNDTSTRIKMTLVEHQNDTGGSVKMKRVPVSNSDGYRYQNDTHNRQVLKTSPKDSLQTNPPNPPNDVIDIVGVEIDSEEEGGVSHSPHEEEEEESEEEMRNSRKVAHIQDLILRKWSKQLTAKPPIGKVKDALREFGWDHMPMETALNKAPDTLNSPHPIAALNLVLAMAKNNPGGNVGMTAERLADAEATIKQMEEDLEKAKANPDKNAAYIEQTEFLLEQKKDALERAVEK